MKPMMVTAIAFAAIAFLYASVGFGGGSSYTAILIESGLSWQLVPPLSLVCNIIVVSGGVYHFARAGHLDIRFALPLVATSVPAAFFGGLLQLQEPTFLIVLGIALLVSGLLLLLDRQWQAAQTAAARLGTSGLGVLGLLLGGVAGVTGIGGGIYLAPVLHYFRLAPARTVAATSSLFILVNSLSGLGGQLAKLGAEATVLLAAQYLALPLAVLIGGQIGSRLGATKLPASPIRRLTGLVVLIVSCRILWQVAFP
jgi:uncharacterized membrane protein YfcA